MTPEVLWAVLFILFMSNMLEVTCCFLWSFHLLTQHKTLKLVLKMILDNLGLTCFTIITDNAANMKCAFEVENQDFEARNVADRNKADRNEDELDDDEINLLSQWTPCEVKVEGWLGCAAHQLQLVVLDGYREIKSYRRVQAVFAKANAIAALSSRSSHFSYSLSKKIPKPCDTRWNSHIHLHGHLIKKCDDINRALHKPTVN